MSKQIRFPIGYKGGKVVKALSAYSKWIAAGTPRPTEEQLRVRISACQSCQHYKDNTCTLCGCSISHTKIIGNIDIPGKAEMATEQCPDNPPRWLSLDTVTQPNLTRLKDT